MLAERDIAWVSGLLEGEGSFTLKKVGVPQSGVCITVTMTDLDVLERLASIVGGRIYKLKERNPNHKPTWKWQINGEQAYTLAKLVLPNLLGRRTSQAMALVEKFELSATYKNTRRGKEMRELHEKGYTHKEIAEVFGLTRSAVSYALLAEKNSEYGTHTPYLTPSLAHRA